MAEVQFCEHVIFDGTGNIAERLKNDGIDVEIAPCLGYCGNCMDGPFALVDYDFVQAPTVDALYEKIKGTV